MSAPNPPSPDDDLNRGGFASRLRGQFSHFPGEGLGSRLRDRAGTVRDQGEVLLNTIDDILSGKIEFTEPEGPSRFDVAKDRWYEAHPKIESAAALGTRAVGYVVGKIQAFENAIPTQSGRALTYLGNHLPASFVEPATTWLVKPVESVSGTVANTAQGAMKSVETFFHLTHSANKWGAQTARNIIAEHPVLFGDSDNNRRFTFKTLMALGSPIIMDAAYLVRGYARAIQGAWKNTSESYDDAADRLPLLLGSANTTRRNFMRGAARIAATSVTIASPAIVYYGAGQLSGSVNNDLDFVAEPPKGGSYAVEMLAALLERELDGGWHPSDWLNPARVKTDVIAYQEGMQKAMGMIAIYMFNYFRGGNGTTTNQDLVDASGAINFYVDKASLVSDGSTVDHYRKGVATLRSFNKKMAREEVGISPRINSLLAFLGQASHDFGSDFASMDRVAKATNWISQKARKEYFFALGRTYTYAMVYGALGKDFEEVLDKQAGAAEAYKLAIDTMRNAISESGRPSIILNGGDNSTLLALGNRINNAHNLIDNAYKSISGGMTPL